MYDNIAQCFREKATIIQNEKKHLQKEENDAKKCQEEEYKKQLVISALHDFIDCNKLHNEFKKRAESGFSYSYRVIRDKDYYYLREFLENKECVDLVNEIKKDGYDVSLEKVDYCDEYFSILFVSWIDLPSDLDLDYLKLINKFFGDDEEELKIQTISRIKSDVCSGIWVPSYTDSCFGERTKYKSLKPYNFSPFRFFTPFRIICFCVFITIVYNYIN